MQTPTPLDKDYIKLVAQHVRGSFPDEFEELISTPEEARKVRCALISLKKEVESQLSSYKSRMNQERHRICSSGNDESAWIAYKAEEAEWRARVTKFLKSIEDYMMATKQRIRSFNTDEEIPKLVPRKAAAEVLQGTEVG